MNEHTVNWDTRRKTCAFKCLEINCRPKQKKEQTMKGGVESYMHRFAKQTVASWLRKRSKVGSNFKGLQPILNSLPLHNKGPMFGVFEEFPVSQDIGITLCANPECSSTDHGWNCWTLANNKKTCQRNGIPTLRELHDWKLPTTWIFDIGIIDTHGKLCFVAEICHKNPMNDAKIAWLKLHNIQWIELNAEWIMNRIKSPFDLTEGIMRSSLHLQK